MNIKINKAARAGVLAFAVILPNSSNLWAAEAKLKVSCFGREKDLYGAPKGRDVCYIMAVDSNFRRDNPSVPAEGLVGYIVEISSSGMKPVKEKEKIPSCPRKQLRVSVDGERIDNRPIGYQLEKIQSGSVYIREKIRYWPYCDRGNVAARLEGIKDAFVDLRRAWEAHNAR